MIDLSFLRQLDRFSLILRKRVTSSYVGDRSTPLVGRGLIYKDHALYSPEEDFRAIDWKVYARTDKLYVKRYEEERNVTVHVLIDVSGSMNFGTKFKKSEYAGMVGLGFGHIALKNNERFVLSTFGEQLDQFKPRKGKKQLMSALSYLNKKRSVGKTKFAANMLKYEKRIKSKALMIIISDFLVDPAEVEEAAAILRRHDVRFIQVFDRMEEDLAAYEGEYKLIDLEQGNAMKTYVSPLLKRSYGQRLRMHRAKVKKAIEDSGARFDHCNTGMPIFDTFHQLLLRAK